MLSRFRKKQPLSPGIYRGQQQEDTQARESQLRRLLVLAAFLFLVLAVTKRLNLSNETEEINTDGVIAQQTVVAEIDFESEDLEETRQARETAAAQVPDVFQLDDAKVKQQLSRLNELVTRIQAIGIEAQQIVAEAGPQASSADVSRRLRELAESRIASDTALRGIKPESLVVWITPDRDRAAEAATAPADSGSSETAPTKPAARLSHVEELAAAARSGLEGVLRQGILAPGERGSDFSKDPERTILILRGNPAQGQYAEDRIRLEDVLTVDTAQTELPSSIAKAAQPGTRVAPDRIRLQDAAFDVARLFVADTLQFDSMKTNAMREEARRNVAPVLKQVMAQEEIQRENHRWTPQSRVDVKTYIDVKSRYDNESAGIVGAVAGHAVLIAVVLFAFLRALPWLTRDRERRFQILCLALLVTCGTVGIGRIVTYFIDIGFVVPAAAGAILLAILTNARVAGFTSVVIALLLSVQFDYSWQMLVVTGAMSFTGVMSIYRVRKRSDMGNAAVKATLVGVLIIVAMALTQDSLFADSTLYSLMMIAVNGVFCLGLVPAVLSPLERLFGITTDIQLLEYSDLNNPILSRLAMEVPATYAHSLMIGQLAEAAADAIGANGLLARVCAYYHDIGKLKRPEYFVENQTGANIHDELSPRLSARAIASHVAEGAEMARELHLPKPIIDGILEHHGTCLISFFYKEAVAQSKHGGVLEADYRYPGPRPRSRETAILMICDAVESAVRTLKNPNEERVREMIDRIIASRASDRQFDECDLTLKNLDTIAEVLTLRVTSTQHKRIAYPEQKPEPKMANVIPLSGGQE